MAPLTSANILIQCGDHLENQLRVLGLARACKDLGWNPVVLVYATSTGNLFLEAGVDVLALNTYRWRTSGVVRPFRRKLAGLNFDSVYKGVSIREVLWVESLRRPWLFTPAKLLPRLEQAVRNIDALEAVANDIQPAWTVVWNGYTGVVANVLRAYVKDGRVKGAFIERGPMPGSLFIDREGVNGASGLAALSEHRIAAAAPCPTADGLRERFATTAPSPEAQEAIRARFGLYGKKVVFVPLQVQADTNVLLHSPHVRTMRQLCLHVLGAIRATGRSDVIVVARPHPEEDPSVRLNLPVADDLLVIPEGELEDWIDMASAVVTLNSTVGFQAAVRNTPIIALGRGNFTRKGFTYDVEPRDLAAILGPLLDGTGMGDQQRKSLEAFLRYIHRHHLFFPPEPEHRSANLDLAAALLGPPPRSPRPNERPFNPWRLDPVTFAGYCIRQRAVFTERARTAAAVSVLVELGPTDCLNLTYRKCNQPITVDHITQIVGQYSGGTSKPSKITRRAEDVDPGSPLIVIAAQRRQPRFRAGHRGPILVIDEYGMPHPAQLTSHKAAALEVDR